MMKKVFTMLLLVALTVSSFLFCTVAAHAASPKAATVRLVNFPVALQGVVFNSSSHEHWQYPFIVYKDITYVPMTYSNGHMMNLNADWTAEKGLTVTLGDPAQWKETLEMDYTPQKNSSRLQATIAKGPVTVNGKTIDNAKEPYPLLVCRDITYFPLTWHFAVEEFGWEYSYDAKTGLHINADNSFWGPYTGAAYQSGTQATYVRDGLRIWAVCGTDLGGMYYENLYIERGGQTAKPAGAFGYSTPGAPTPMTPILTVQGDWVTTTILQNVTNAWTDVDKAVPCRMNINTLAIENL